MGFNRFPIPKYCMVAGVGGRYAQNYETKVSNRPLIVNSLFNLVGTYQ